MNFRSIGLLAFLSLTLLSCEKNTVSKIPLISLTGFEPQSGYIHVNVDTAFIRFTLIDGDADIAGDSSSSIHFRDSRYDYFTTNPFPTIDPSIEDPKKGLEGICDFYPFPQPIPRLDSLHRTTGDTLYYEIYITDRAGHESNHLITPTFVIKVP